MILKNTSETFYFRGVFDTFINNVYFDTKNQEFLQDSLLSSAIFLSCSRIEFSMRNLSSPLAPCKAVFSLSSLLETISSSALFSSSAKFSLFSEFCIFFLTLSVNTPPSFVMLSITSRALKKRLYRLTPYSAPCRISFIP